MVQGLEGAGRDRGRPEGKAPLVTVVVPAYNHARYVGECLDSIVQSSYPDIDLIVINDASRDETAAVIRQWIRDHPAYDLRFIDHAKNVGLTKSLNEAIGMADGTYFCHISGDDVLLPDGIAARVAFLEAHPEKQAVFADCHVIDGDGNPLYQSGIEDLRPENGMRKSKLRIDELIPYEIVFHWALPGPIFMCRMALFRELGLYNEEYFIEDWDLYLRIAATGKLGFLDAYVANFRWHQTNAGTLNSNLIEGQMVAMARRNMPRFGPINRLRLAAFHYGTRLRREEHGLAKIPLYVLTKILLVSSWRSYLAVRWWHERRLRNAVR